MPFPKRTMTSEESEAFIERKRIRIKRNVDHHRSSRQEKNNDENSQKNSVVEDTEEHLNSEKVRRKKDRERQQLHRQRLKVKRNSGITITEITNFGNNDVNTVKHCGGLQSNSSTEKIGDENLENNSAIQSVREHINMEEERRRKNRERQQLYRQRQRAIANQISIATKKNCVAPNTEVHINSEEICRKRNRERQQLHRDQQRVQQNSKITDLGNNTDELDVGLQSNAQHYCASREEWNGDENAKNISIVPSTQEHRNMEEVRKRKNRERQQLHRQRQRVIVERNSEMTDIGNNDINIVEHYGGLLNAQCIHCNAKHFVSETTSKSKNSFHDCCSHGKVRLDELPKIPDVLYSLFNGSHSKSSEFFSRIRIYNNSLSFASLNANLMNFNDRRPGPWCFRIAGQIYYQINTAAHPSPNDLPSNGQLFIVDPEEAINSIHRQNHSLDRELIEIIEGIIRENNIFAQSYQMMGQEIEAQNLRSINSIPHEELNLVFTTRPGLDHRRYNIQQSNEVAAVFSTTADGAIPESYVIVHNKNTKKLKRVSSMDPNVEPWVYPLFYPFGNRGWSHNLRQATNQDKRVTREAYTRYRMAIRENDNTNAILLGRRLFQQWVVDQYVKIEKDRIDFIRHNQVSIRADSYTGLKDYLEKVAENSNTRIGKIVILPSSFTGSPRNMMQHYQDAMAIVRKFGKPDLFITMTCNPNWREIRENLLPGQQPSDRPDLTARVFDMKLKHLIDLLTKKKIFGEVLAFVYTIESQKRGLLHAHMLLTLKNKLSTAEQVDKIISAEIPDPNLYPDLHQIVMKNMIHGPCGSWCKVNDKCSKKFPKMFQSETKVDDNGFPQYRRKETGILYERSRGHVVDNQWVVPYSPVLLRTFNCHINTEIVATVNAPKYLYKYVYKGHDAASIQIMETPNDCETSNSINHDECTSYIESRYVGPNEAVWRILDKKMQMKSHPIIRLPVHLPNEQTITFSESTDSDTIREALTKSTMLLDYFSLNQRDEAARQYLYSEIPSHYVYKKTKRTNNGITPFQWQKRQQCFNSVGRMYSVSPSQTELFHLRLLLLNVKGATSFEHLRTVNHEIQQTFVAACLALGLIEDDDEWERAMQEAATWMMPSRIRNLFVRILLHCNPIYPEKLWEKFKIELSEDYRRFMDDSDAQRKAYSNIIRMLASEGSDISHFPQMPQLQISDEFSLDVTSNSEYMRIGSELYHQLNITQKEIVDVIMNDIDNRDQNIRNCYYIDGPGGTGKTFIYNTLSYLTKSKGKSVKAMAFTGIAATLLPEGKTVHKMFGLPVPLFADSASSIKVQSKQGQDLRDVDLFIWDEAPMAPRYALELIDRTLRDFMNNDKPFGGKIFVLGGYFRQLLPIKVGGTRNETIDLSIKHSLLWKHFHTFYLTQNMRVRPDEVEFAKFLLEVGDGTLNDYENNLHLPERCILPKNKDIITEVYGNLIKEKQYKEASKCVILSARNIDVDEINMRVIDLLDKNTEKVYTGIDSTEKCNERTEQIAEHILPEYLHTLAPPNLPHYEIRLRKFAIVMLIRNLCINEGLCNGTRLMILELGNNVLRCQILSGDKKGYIVFINRVTLYCENEYPFTFKRRQFPIKIAFAMTINKSQGQTFEKIGVDLRNDVFNHGQIYVAFSRVRAWDALIIFLGNQRNGNIVKNYVYKEMLN